MPESGTGYRALWELGTAALEKAGISDARLDARLLLESVCGTSLTTLLSEPERPISPAQQKDYEDLISRRALHEPAAYILGSQEFMGLPFAVNPSVLIPNQDTETLVELAMQQLHSGMRILDLCTGSGCILLSLLHYSLNTSGTGTDLSGEALAVAEQNAKSLGLSDRCRFIQGDLFAALGDESELYDLLVSNPPYIRREVIGTLETEVAQKEPYLALCGGEDGLDFYRRIAKEASRFVKPGGALLFEIGYDQAEDVCRLLEEAGHTGIRVEKDYAGLDRVVLCRIAIPGLRR